MITAISYHLATAGTTTAPAAGATSLLFPLLLVGGFVLLIILPQRRARKQQAQLQSSLSIGDEVRTVGGIRGRITSMDDDTVVIEVESGTLRVDRRAVAAKTSG
jgi:preprotein translocase subunit YajC